MYNYLSEAVLAGGLVHVQCTIQGHLHVYVQIRLLNLAVVYFSVCVV